MPGAICRRSPIRWSPASSVCDFMPEGPAPARVQTWERCVLSAASRGTSQEIADLRDLAAIVMDRLELRLSARRAIAQYEAELAERRRLAQSLEERVNSATEERLKAEIALQQAQKMEVIGELTSGIAHDFNNLLTIIAGNIETLQRRLPQAANDLRRLAENAMHGTSRAADLTRGLLRFSRRRPIELSTVDVEPARHRFSSSVAAHTRRKDCD